MNCVLCDKKLESALPEDMEEKHAEQPYAGGEIFLRFCFGSTKFDNSPGFTEYSGIICDDCAEPMTKKMKEKLYGWDGEPWSEEIQAEINAKLWENPRFRKIFEDSKSRQVGENYATEL